MTSAVPSSSTRHRGRRAALTAVLAGALIAGGTVVATTVAAPAGAEPQFQDQGTLSLETQGGVTTATLGTTTQTFTTSGQCQLTSSGPTLLRFSGQVGQNNGNVGFQGGTFGVAEKPSGTSCVEVNANKQSSAETLIIKLGGSDVFPLLASAATLDIEAKGTAARTTIAFYLEGVLKDTQVIDCNSTTSDSGPDAKSGDNCIKENIARNDAEGGYFDELRISASSGAAVSLEGGQDWADSTIKTTFDVGYFAETPVACNSSTVKVDGTASTPSVQIRNISRSDGNSCQNFVYELTSSGGQATFLKPYSEQSQALQFVMDLEWQIPAGSSAALPKVFFGFHDVNLVEGTARELGWCANPVFGTTAPFLATGIGSTPTTAMDVETNNTLFPGVQYACMADSKVKRDAAGKPIAWFQSIYVHGDAFARR
jgi:hypothetical protein